MVRPDGRRRNRLLDGLQEVALLGVVAVLEELSDVLTHTGWKRSVYVSRHGQGRCLHTDGNLGHLGRLPVEFRL